jgi:anti-sigma regulatory factor (Ser/Thr protein kinase)
MNGSEGERLRREDRLDVDASLHLPADPTSAARARRFIGEFCTAAQLPTEVCQTAALLVSELVTNAVVHGRTSATIEVHRPAQTLRVAVRDDNPDLPPVGSTPDLTSESGRGLLIVSRLSRRWGVERVGPGKAVWFELGVEE